MNPHPRVLDLNLPDPPIKPAEPPKPAEPLAHEIKCTYRGDEWGRYEYRGIKIEWYGVGNSGWYRGGSYFAENEKELKQRLDPEADARDLRQLQIDTAATTGGGGI